MAILELKICVRNEQSFDRLDHSPDTTKKRIRELTYEDQNRF